MTFSTKELSIIYFLNYENYVTSSEISKQFYFTPKTVYRIIKKINDVGKELFDKEIIFSEPGKGYKLNSYFLDKDLKNLSSNNSNSDDYNVILKILFNHPKKTAINSLFKNSYYSDSTIQRRIKHIEAYLTQFEIYLEQSRLYLWIEGKEEQIRKAIQFTLILTNNSSQTNLVNNNIDLYDKRFIESQIELIENTFEIEIPYPYDVNLFTHIYMLLTRYREGKVSFLQNQEPLTAEEKLQLKNNTEIYKISKIIKQNIDSYLSVSLDEMEEYFIFQNIYSFSYFEQNFQNIDVEVAREFSTQLVKEYFNLDTFIDKKYLDLIEDLYYHILPMINRLRVGIYIENNMLEEIQLEYFETFNKLKNIIPKVQNKFEITNQIFDSEIGFITLYFEKYLTTNKKNILLLCSTGIGTSELLRIKLQNAFPEFNIVSTMGFRQLKNSNFEILEKVDYIFSTIRINDNSILKPVINISPILSEKDIQLIRYTVEEEKKLDKEIDLTKVINKSLMIVQSKASSKKEILIELSNLLEKEGYVQSSEEFLKDVYLREEEGITGIGSNIAIPHGKSDAVIKTTVAIATLEDEIYWETLDGKGVKVIILFAVQDTDATTTHILLLQKVAILLADDDFLESLKAVSSVDELYQLFIDKY